MARWFPSLKNQFKNILPIKNSPAKIQTCSSCSSSVEQVQVNVFDPKTHSGRYTDVFIHTKDGLRGSFYLTLNGTDAKGASPDSSKKNSLFPAVYLMPDDAGSLAQEQLQIFGNEFQCRRSFPTPDGVDDVKSVDLLGAAFRDETATFVDHIKVTINDEHGKRSKIFPVKKHMRAFNKMTFDAEK
ncbi:unnamed protein product [Notodromas monacha]|uniref:Uncharacterized protein n=1 Tax=Notodromas monacha TaxID=399045 RepID=A0A7R9BTX0_9CRUS|nr:unnamed protein product [Notodromas monacha]CAG0920288.1 unnamed protein product [Notodromas monacha]